MKQPSVRLSVCPIIRPPPAAAAGLLLCARLVDCCLAWRRSTRTPRKLAGWRAGVNPLYIVHHSNEQTSKQTFSVYTG